MRIVTSDVLFGCGYAALVNGQKLHARLANGYAYISDKPSALRSALYAPAMVFSDTQANDVASLTLHISRVPKSHWNHVFDRLRQWLTNPEMLPSLEVAELLMIQMAVNFSIPQLQSQLERTDYYRLDLRIDTAGKAIAHFEYRERDRLGVRPDSTRQKRESLLDPIRKRSVLSWIAYSHPPEVYLTRDIGAESTALPVDILQFIGVVGLNDVFDERMSAGLSRVLRRMAQPDKAPFELAFFLLEPEDGSESTGLAVARGTVGQLMSDFIEDQVGNLRAGERQTTHSRIGSAHVLHIRFKDETYHLAANEQLLLVAGGESGLAAIKATLHQLKDATPTETDEDFRLEYRALRHFVLQKDAKLARLESELDGVLLRLATERIQKQLDQFSAGVDQEEIDVDAPAIVLTGYSDGAGHCELEVTDDLIKALSLLSDQQ